MTAAVEIAPLPAPPQASVVVPGSKSYTNRALIAAALASGPSVLRGALFSDDTRYMEQALNRLGVRVESDAKARTFAIQGTGGQFSDSDAELFVGNAGTAARFLTATAASGSGHYRLDGVERMRHRPMADLFSALRALGVEIVEHGASGCLPVTVSGRSRAPGPVELELPGNASSQFISGLLLAAPAYHSRMTLSVKGELVSKPYLDMTLAVMDHFGVQVERDGYHRFVVPVGSGYGAREYRVEPDASAASYFYAAAAITGGAITVEGLGSETLQGDWNLVDILEQMGARVERTPNRTTVRGTGTLHGVEVDMKNLSDVAQTLAVVAPFADSPTRITGIGFIRHKETDRVGHVVAELKKLGIRAEEEDDGYTVYPGTPKPGMVETYDDHRMAMSFALLGLRHPGIRILNPTCTSKTFPEFFDVLAGLASSQALQDRGSSSESGPNPR